MHLLAQVSGYWSTWRDMAAGLWVLAQCLDLLRYHVYIYCHLWPNLPGSYGRILMTSFGCNGIF